MDLKDPESMTTALSRVLRYGVIVSGATILAGVLLLVFEGGASGTAAQLVYNSGEVPHSAFSYTLGDLFSGVASLKPYAIIDLGAILLIGTPVSRVAVSVALFAAERDRLYVAITAVVLALLLFSIFVTPLIPSFQA